MARTELPNGIILPAEYSDDWYDDMTSNLSKLDEVIGSDAEKLSEEDVGAAALSNDYTDLDNKPALKPVATSGDYDDLDNKPALKPVATSGDYDDLTDLPTYGITRLCSSAITDNSSVAFSNISSTDKIKVGDFLLDTNGKLYQISSVDTATETVSVTTPLTQLAVDSSVVHNSGNETKSGELTVSKLISNTVQSSTGNIQVQSLGSNKSVAMYNGASAGDGGGFWAYGKDSANGSDCRMQIYNKSKSRYERVDLVNSQFLSTPSGELDCGSTSNKWKTFNGINPGALSFPDLNNGIDISGYITNFGAGTVNEYTPIADGWVSIANSGDSPIFIRVYNDYGFEQIAYSERNEVGDTTGGTYTRYGSLMIPCIKNIKIYIIVSPSSSVLVSAKFYPCLGNV